MHSQDRACIGRNSEHCVAKALIGQAWAGEVEVMQEPEGGRVGGREGGRDGGREAGREGGKNRLCIYSQHMKMN